MANYAYIYLNKPTTAILLEARLRAVTQEWFGDRMRVEEAWWSDLLHLRSRLGGQ